MKIVAIGAHSDDREYVFGTTLGWIPLNNGGREMHTMRIKILQESTTSYKNWYLEYCILLCF